MKLANLAVIAIFVLAACSKGGSYKAETNNVPQLPDNFISEIHVQEAAFDADWQNEEVKVLHSAATYTHTSDIILIAHAGGAVHGYENTNSIEAIRNAHVQNFRYIELDMIVTSDGKTVLKHSWETAANVFGGLGNGTMSYHEFMNHTIHGRFTPTDLYMLIAFLKENPGPRIITDTKDTDYNVLYEIALKFPEQMYRFIPQVYRFGDSQRIRALGFEDIILTTYMLRVRDPVQIREYALQNGIYAVGIPDDLATGNFIARLNPGKVQVFVHTVDDIYRARYLRSLGVQMLMTAFLTYNDDLTCILRVESPLRDYFISVESNIQSLYPSELELAEAAVFYRMGNPVYVSFGTPLPISGSMDRMVEIFTSPISGQTYFAARNFSCLAENIRFSSSNNNLRINANGQEHVLGTGDFHIYRSVAFVSQAFVEKLFGLIILRCEDYIVLAPQSDIYFEEELLHVAREIFGTS